MFISNKNQKGFTLIELLVVISIIGLISSIVLVSIKGTRGKARDAVRKQDFYSLQYALEMYYLEHDEFPHYISPPAPPPDPDKWINCGSALGCTTDSSLPKFLKDLVDEGYFFGIPRDPINIPPTVCYMYSNCTMPLDPLNPSNEISPKVYSLISVFKNLDDPNCHPDSPPGFCVYMIQRDHR